MNKGRMFLCGVVGIGVAACGGSTVQVATTTPSNNTTTTNAEIAKAEPKTAEPAPEPAKPEPQAELVIPETKTTAEPCEARLWWTCVTVALDSKKIDKRETLLLGDPNIEETKSGTTDGRKTVDFPSSNGETLSVVLRRKPGQKTEIVLKSGKGETVIDRHDGDDYQYVSVIAAEKGGKAYVDVRYMR